MAIKSDRWIQQMAHEHGMIEPFQDAQVRQGVISYGLSSYGYDMRIADEFKVFTNVFNTLVDPKHFDPRSFVDIKAEYIDIPPNSFALARSVEYFRIPRRVLSIVLGKSTYARCFRGDTQVALVDGRTRSLEDLARDWEGGIAACGYGIDHTGAVVATTLMAPRYIASDALLEMTLDNGARICCTPDHQFLLRNGTLILANDLRPGTSLMPLYRDQRLGATTVYQPQHGQHTLNQQLIADWQRRTSRSQAIDAGRAVWHPAIFPATHAGVALRNHTVAAVRELPGTHDVYCLTAPETGNFALGAGVFVKNCGLIVNVTPLEPEWQGYVTIEISNTTPLPARVYANEGVAQVLFLESDEDCAVSYADKSGKYQNQVGVVPPRM